MPPFMYNYIPAPYVANTGYHGLLGSLNNVFNVASFLNADAQMLGVTANNIATASSMITHTGSTYQTVSNEIETGKNYSQVNLNGSKAALINSQQQLDAMKAEGLSTNGTLPMDKHEQKEEKKIRELDVKIADATNENKKDKLIKERDEKIKDLQAYDYVNYGGAHFKDNGTTNPSNNTTTTTPNLPTTPLGFTQQFHKDMVAASHLTGDAQKAKLAEAYELLAAFGKQNGGNLPFVNFQSGLHQPYGPITGNGADGNIRLSMQLVADAIASSGLGPQVDHGVMNAVADSEVAKAKTPVQARTLEQSTQDFYSDMQTANKAAAGSTEQKTALAQAYGVLKELADKNGGKLDLAHIDIANTGTPALKFGTVDYTDKTKYPTTDDAIKGLMTDASNDLASKSVGTAIPAATVGAVVDVTSKTVKTNDVINTTTPPTTTTNPDPTQAQTIADQQQKITDLNAQIANLNAQVNALDKAYKEEKPQNKNTTQDNTTDNTELPAGGQAIQAEPAVKNVAPKNMTAAQVKWLQDILRAGDTPEANALNDRLTAHPTDSGKFGQRTLNALKKALNLTDEQVHNLDFSDANTRAAVEAKLTGSDDQSTQQPEKQNVVANNVEATNSSQFFATMATKMGFGSDIKSAETTMNTMLKTTFTPDGHITKSEAVSLDLLLNSDAIQTLPDDVKNKLIALKPQMTAAITADGITQDADHVYHDQDGSVITPTAYNVKPPVKNQPTK